PTAVVAHQYDGQHQVPFEIIPDLAIDTFRNLPDGQPNPYYGSLYEVWSRYYPPGQFPGEPNPTGGSDIMIAVSRDGGRTWQTQLQPHPVLGIPVSVISQGAVFNTGSGTVSTGTGKFNWSHLAVGPEGDVYVSCFWGGGFAMFH